MVFNNGPFFVLLQIAVIISTSFAGILTPWYEYDSYPYQHQYSVQIHGNSWNDGKYNSQYERITDDINNGIESISYYSSTNKYFLFNSTIQTGIYILYFPYLSMFFTVWLIVPSI